MSQESNVSLTMCGLLVEHCGAGPAAASQQTHTVHCVSLVVHLPLNAAPNADWLTVLHITLDESLLARSIRQRDMYTRRRLVILFGGTSRRRSRDNTVPERHSTLCACSARMRHHCARSCVGAHKRSTNSVNKQSRSDVNLFRSL